MKRTIWLLCKIFFVILVLVAFSPLVLSEEITPTIGGIPRTLWSGILVSLGFILLTLVGATVINSKNDK